MNTKYILATIAVLLLGSAFYSLSASRSERAANTDTASSTPLFATSTSIDLSAPENAPAGTVIERVDFPPQKVAIPAPDFKKPLVCTAGTDVCASLQTKYSQTQTALTKDSSDFWSWIDLGTLRKAAGDYTGAATVWEFVSKQYPSNPTSFANLGDLYANYLKDTVKAEKNYLASIKNYTENANAYRALFEMYSAQKATTKAIAILEKGIAANPKMIDLRVLLARYYKELGRPSDATATYYAAIQAAESQGQKDLAASLRSESGL
ncbi:MAG: hypothetical protein RLZZ342_206 [Candidatus Parcubacteria bacterium]